MYSQVYLDRWKKAVSSASYELIKYIELKYQLEEQIKEELERVIVILSDNYSDLDEEYMRIIKDKIIGACEFVSYSDAIDFLSKEDSSLGTSLLLAKEFGYYIEDLDSCILAHLLLEDALMYDLEDLCSEVALELNKYLEERLMKNCNVET